jgi:hypothetical protein
VDNRESSAFFKEKLQGYIPRVVALIFGKIIEHALPTAVPFVKFDIVSAPSNNRA